MVMTPNLPIIPQGFLQEFIPLQLWLRQSLNCFLSLWIGLHSFKWTHACVWFLSLSIMPLRSRHVVVGTVITFFFSEVQSPLPCVIAQLYLTIHLFSGHAPPNPTHHPLRFKAIGDEVALKI